MLRRLELFLTAELLLLAPATLAALCPTTVLVSGRVENAPAGATREDVVLHGK